ncbi:MAG: hypothetical protein IKO11_09170, partial [Lachnospiraceae bacterium]|nr:hypothetical protein [Lachnospiraceae bacterium]
MKAAGKEKSIIGRINDMSHRLMVMLLAPIVLSLVLMLFYAGKYDQAIIRMETIASLKTVVAEEIPETMWNIVSGRDTIEGSRVYVTLRTVNETIQEVTDRTVQENRLSLIVAGRTMQTLQNYVDRIRDNISAGIPVVQSEAVLAEIRDVSSLVESMLNDYISEEIASTGRMSLTLRKVIITTAILEALIVAAALL